MRSEDLEKLKGGLVSPFCVIRDAARKLIVQKWSEGKLSKAELAELDEIYQKHKGAD